MMNYEAQKGYVVAARYACDDAIAAQFVRKVEQLARHHVIAYAIRNRVRQELKQQLFKLPPRRR